MTDRKQLIAQISKRRRQCLVHRFLYYVLNESLIGDYQYDMMERDLRALVEQHPDLAKKAELDGFCPTRTVGSSNLDDYPRWIDQLAESLLATHRAAVRSPAVNPAEHRV